VPIYTRNFLIVTVWHDQCSRLKPDARSPAMKAAVLHRYDEKLEALVFVSCEDAPDPLIP
jgi:hypothetical protein